MVNSPAPSSNDVKTHHESVGAWAKRYYFANRAAIESVLRPYGIGTTQWYVLYQLANDGPTIQRDLGQLLHLERATLSGIVSTLVRKGHVEQVPGATDQRQRVLHLTKAGRELWEGLPDPIAVIGATSLQDISEAELATAVRVLKAATRRLNDYMADGDRT